MVRYGCRSAGNESPVREWQVYYALPRRRRDEHGQPLAKDMQESRSDALVLSPLAVLPDLCVRYFRRCRRSIVAAARPGDNEDPQTLVYLNTRSAEVGVRNGARLKVRGCVFRHRLAH